MCMCLYMCVHEHWWKRSQKSCQMPWSWGYGSHEAPDAAVTLAVLHSLIDSLHFHLITTASEPHESLNSHWLQWSALSVVSANPLGYTLVGYSSFQHLWTTVKWSLAQWGGDLWVQGSPDSGCLQEQRLSLLSSPLNTFQVSNLYWKLKDCF